MNYLTQLLILACVLVSGCSDQDAAAQQQATQIGFTVAGRLEDDKIREASGLARSQREPGVLWVINDSGAKEVLYALDLTGASLGRTELKKSKNKDWEDLASFTLDGEPYLVVADIGDNDLRHKTRTLYFLKEPKAGKDKTTVDWEVRFEYPNGRRDAEAMAVDIDAGRALILSKRDIPPQLYEVPLRTDGDDKITAKWLGTIESLPKPSRQDVEFAPKTKDWHWQPVSMDISQDNRAAVIITYRAAYYYLRRPDQTWFDALNSKPVRISLGNFKNAEAVAFADDQRSVVVTGENKHSLLLRVDLSGPVAAPGGDDVTIMSFNVQNLFDNIDDPGKDDKAYLPLAAKQYAKHIEACNSIEVASWRDECLYLDWSDAALDHKLSVLATTIRQVNDGRGADVIALQEVENVAILERLRKEYLDGLGYLPAILIEGTDTRGIDVAFLSKLPLVGEPKLHPLLIPEFPDRQGDTRGVLQADFRMPDGSVLTGFSVHFPAPFHPTPMRIAAYEHLAALRDALPDDHHVFAAGDFNTTSSEDARENLLDNYARPVWAVAHDLGCGDCEGTYYYGADGTWSFLDMILFSPARGEKTTAKIRADSVAIANGNPAQVSSEGVPERYRSAESTGVSDHWPIVATIEMTGKQ
jgi:hypothetical protein